MPWCPKCRLEYREGFAKCSDCDSDLVEKLDDDVKEESEVIEYTVDPPMEPVLLVTVGEHFEAELILNMLKEADIRCYFKDKGAGSYMSIYMGFSIYGADIFVDKKDFDKANELLIVMNEQPDIVEVDEETEKSIQTKQDFQETEEEVQQSQDIRKGILKTLIITVLAISAIALIAAVLHIFLK
ncbi:MAG: hypothetical protein A2Y17_03220 [Clostridiales bacterium GWF2_38_85]|nr:MAG: hypothetical protein A2Y17_03220 [Clostridiales bacterium GWF2_38_85]HBL85219.1 hypothetical protein [Clostridiales bacterium]